MSVVSSADSRFCISRTNLFKMGYKYPPVVFAAAAADEAAGGDAATTDGFYESNVV